MSAPVIAFPVSDQKQLLLDAAAAEHRITPAQWVKSAAFELALTVAQIGTDYANPENLFTLPGTFTRQEQAKAAAQAHIAFLGQLRAQASLTLAKGEPTI